MHKKSLFILLGLIALSFGAYEPEVLITVTPQLINKFVADNNQTIIDQINKFHIQDPGVIEQKVQGVKITLNLTQIKQKVDINWVTNVIQVVNRRSFKITSKNINITLDGHIEAKIGALPKQKGPLKVTVTKLDAEVVIRFESPKCAKGIGFDVQISSVTVDAKDVVIKIQGKGFDNRVIAIVEKYVMPRVPGLLEKAVQQQLNPLISNLTCQRIEEQVEINEKGYLVVLNTTEVPSFDDSLRYLRLLVDLTLQNMITNETNNELESDQLPGDPVMAQMYGTTLAMSSNFMNTIVWAVGDSQILNLVVTNDMLGDDPPIALNTTNLSILLPNLKTPQWANKEVALIISPSTPFEHLVIRSGRLVSVLSLSIKFIVNLNGNTSNVTDCLLKQQCVQATDLNVTLPLSLSFKLNKTDIVGLLHQVTLSDVQIIHSKIKVNTMALESILNSIVGSMIPSVNNQLIHSIPVPEALANITQSLHIDRMEVKTYLDYVGVGLDFDL